MVKKQIVRIQKKKPFKATIKSKKNSNFSEKLKRIVGILKDINDEKDIDEGELTTGILAERYGVSRRAIQRDRILLEDLGILGHGSKWQFDETFNLKKIRITPEQEYCLELIEKFFAGVGGGLDKAARELNDKVLAESDSVVKTKNNISVSDQSIEMLADELKYGWKRIEAYCQDEPESLSLEDKILLQKKNQFFEKETKVFVRNVEYRVKGINNADETKLIFEEGPVYKFPRLICSVKIPKNYVLIPDENLLLGSPDFSVGDLNLKHFFKSLEKDRTADRFLKESLKGLIGKEDIKFEGRIVDVLNQLIAQKVFYSKTDGKNLKDELSEDTRYLFDEAKTDGDYRRLNKGLWLKFYPNCLQFGKGAYDGSNFYEIKFFKAPANKFFPDFRICANMYLLYKGWVSLLEPEKFSCFDELIRLFDLPSQSRRVTYEGNGTESFSFTKVDISWEKILKLKD